VFPDVFDAGLATLRDRFGLVIKEYPTTRAAPGALASDPEARARDLTSAFEDPEVDGIIASIGGDDSVRILEHLDARVIAANPKVLMGYSDTTTQLWFCSELGMVTYHGPSVMAGFAQLRHFPEAERHVRELLFDPEPTYDYRPFPQWVDRYADWDSGATHHVGDARDHDGWRWLHAPGRREGRLLGGCVEVLQFLKDASRWPESAAFDGRLLFLETSEEHPSVDEVRAFVADLGSRGVLPRLSGLLLGRARDYSDEEKRQLDDAVRDTVIDEFGADDVVIVSNMDFGHTDPQWILPIGAMAAVDPADRSFRLLSAAVS